MYTRGKKRHRTFEAKLLWFWKELLIDIIETLHWTEARKTKTSDFLSPLCTRRRLRYLCPILTPVLWDLPSMQTLLIIIFGGIIILILNWVDVHDHDNVPFSWESWVWVSPRVGRGTACTWPELGVSRPTWSSLIRRLGTGSWTTTPSPCSPSYGTALHTQYHSSLDPFSQ